MIDALSANDVTRLGVGVIAILIVLGVIGVALVKAVLGRVIVLIVVVVLAIAVWQQRGHIQNSINSKSCNLNATFFGFHLDVPQSVRQACQKR